MVKNALTAEQAFSLAQEYENSETLKAEIADVLSKIYKFIQNVASVGYYAYNMEVKLPASASSEHIYDYAVASILKELKERGFKAVWISQGLRAQSGTQIINRMEITGTLSVSWR